MPYLALTAAMLLWASTYSILKYVFVYFDPFFVLFARMAVATLVMLPLLATAGITRIRRADLGPVLLLGLCEPCLYFLFESEALTRTSAAQAAVLTSLIPVLTTLGARAAFGERQPRATWTGLAISSAGAMLLTAGASPDASAPDPLAGNLLEMLAVCCGVAYTLLTKRMADRYPPLTVTFAQTLTGLAWFGAGMLTPWVRLPDTWPTAACLWVGYLGAAVTFGAFALYTWAIRHVPVSHAAMFTNLIPPFSLALAMLTLGERLDAVQWLACLTILGGVWLGRRRG